MAARSRSKAGLAANLKPAGEDRGDQQRDAQRGHPNPGRVAPVEGARLVARGPGLQAVQGQLVLAPAQVLENRHRVGVAHRGNDLQAPLHDGRQVVVDVLVERPDRLERPLAQLHADLQPLGDPDGGQRSPGPAVEARNLAGQQLVDAGAQGVDVPALVGGQLVAAQGTLDLLGRHEADGAQIVAAVAGGEGLAEVRQPRPPLAVEEDVGGLQITVQDALGVDVAQALSHFFEPHGHLNRRRLHLGQRVGQERHDEEGRHMV
jgi:hypothetical protein